MSKRVDPILALLSRKGRGRAVTVVLPGGTVTLKGRVAKAKRRGLALAALAARQEGKGDSHEQEG